MPAVFRAMAPNVFWETAHPWEFKFLHTRATLLTPTMVLSGVAQ
jgi:hypothetical protein